MSNDYEFTLPLAVWLPMKRVKDKRFSVDINFIRGANRFDYNKAKIAYKEMIEDQFEGLELIDGCISVHYEYYAARNNSPDLDNFIGGAKKFFQDAMVDCGLIADDNVNVIGFNSERYCGVDKDNPRIVAKVYVID